MITINDRRGHDEFDNGGEHSVCENVCTGGKSRGGCLIQILLGAWFSNIWCMQKSLGNFYNKLLIADNKKKFKMQPHRPGDGDIVMPISRNVHDLFKTHYGVSDFQGNVFLSCQCFLMSAAWLLALAILLMLTLMLCSHASDAMMSRHWRM